jgi:indole-3-glycerol phosphate synthase
MLEDSPEDTGGYDSRAPAVMLPGKDDKVMPPPSVLDEIVATKRREVAEAKRLRPLADVAAAAQHMPPARDFYAAVVQPPSAGGSPSSPRLIAEIKKASPSAGLIRPDFDPVEIARTYARCGAAALSVLTDRTYFQGELNYIQAVKDAVPLPVLRKDFIIDEYQLAESRAAGADAILLIAAILTPQQIDAWSTAAHGLGMAVLVEVHSAEELRAVRPFTGPERRVLLGINNRDLRTQTTDVRTTLRLAGGVAQPPSAVRGGQPPSAVAIPFVSESGIKTRAHVEMLSRAGAAAVLIGETLLRAADIEAKLRELGLFVPPFEAGKSGNSW